MIPHALLQEISTLYVSSNLITLMRIQWANLQILCWLMSCSMAYAQNYPRLATQVIKQSSFYQQQTARVGSEQAYTLRPGAPFTSVALRIDAAESFAGMFVVQQGDTLRFTEDEHASTTAAYRQSNLIIFDQPVSEVLFFSSAVRGDITFSLIDARGTKKTAEPSLRTEQPSARHQACEEPAAVLPAVWRQGLPDPSYRRSATEVSHVVIHHSASDNDLTDYENVVRNIYLFHTEDRGWSDIGYNYLVAPDGTIFAGRSPGPSSIERDNVQGAHFCGQNAGTMGVCLLGNYETAIPSDTALQSIAKIAAWKVDKEQLDPVGEQSHPANSALATIAGHRNGCSTLCPGKNLYARLDDIRTEVASGLANGCGEEIAALSVYPVPTRESLTVKLPVDRQAEAIGIFDLSGQRHRVAVASPDEGRTLELNTQSLTRGVYVLRLRGLGWQEQRKIIVP